MPAGTAVKRNRAVVVGDRLLLPIGSGSAQNDLRPLHRTMLRIVDDAAHASKNSRERRNGAQKNECKRDARFVA